MPSWSAIGNVDATNAAMQVVAGWHPHAQPAFRDGTATENNVLMQTGHAAADYSDSHAPCWPTTRSIRYS